MNDKTSRSFDHDDEMVDEAGRESFPASDPPAYSSGVADTPSSTRGEETAAEAGGDPPTTNASDQGDAVPSSRRGDD